MAQRTYNTLLSRATYDFQVSGVSRDPAKTRVYSRPSSHCYHSTARDLLCNLEGPELTCSVYASGLRMQSIDDASRPEQCTPRTQRRFRSRSDA